MEDNKQFIEMTHFEHVDIPHTIESILDLAYPEVRTNMELNEINPCPFCGNTKLKVESKHNGTHYYTGAHSATVRCSKCHARGPTASCKVEKGKYHADEETKQRAIELWNART